MTKVCNVCKKTKSLSEFYPDRVKPNGYQGRCKECTKGYYRKNLRRMRRYYRQYQKKNKIRIRKNIERYVIRNRDRINTAKRRHYLSNIVEMRRKKRAWMAANKDKVRAHNQRYYKANLEQERKRSLELYTANRAKRLDRYRELRKVSPRKMLELYRRYSLSTKYGITHDDFIALKKKQNNRCAICKKPFQNRPFVDHDHKSGKIRGLLCRYCNSGIGMFGDSIPRLRSAIAFLKIKPLKQSKHVPH